MVVDDDEVLPEEFVVLSLDGAVVDNGDSVDVDDDGNDVTEVDDNEDDVPPVDDNEDDDSEVHADEGDPAAVDADEGDPEAEDVDEGETAVVLLDCASVIEVFSSSFTFDEKNFSRFLHIEGDQLEIFSKSSKYSQLIFVFVFMRYIRRDLNFFFMMRTQ